MANNSFVQNNSYRSKKQLNIIQDLNFMMKSIADIKNVTIRSIATNLKIFIRNLCADSRSLSVFKKKPTIQNGYSHCGASRLT